MNVVEQAPPSAFVVGPCNRNAVDELDVFADAVCAQPWPAPRVLFLAGPTGTGKTDLLTRLRDRLRAASVPVVWTTGAGLLEDTVNMARGSRPVSGLPHGDAVIIVDEFETMATANAAQGALWTMERMK